MKLKRALRGGEKGGDVLAIQRALNRWSGQRLPTVPVTSSYDARTRARIRRFKIERSLPRPDEIFRQGTLDELARFFDAYGKVRYLLFRVPSGVPDLGPVFAGGASVLDHDLTHDTDGLPLYPAFDDAYAVGTSIVAPEQLAVTRSSHSRPGLAFYAIGASKIQYWFGHLDRTHSPGERFAKGQVVGKVAPNAVGGGPHVHVGVNVERLFGKGHELEHHSNYTHGAPTIGAQLRRHFAV